MHIDLGTGRNLEATVPAGEAVEIELTSFAASGHAWSLVVEDGHVGGVRHHQVSGSEFGGAGTETFVLDGLSPECTVNLVLQAPWRTTPAELYRLHLSQPDTRSTRTGPRT